MTWSDLRSEISTEFAEAQAPLANRALKYYSTRRWIDLERGAAYYRATRREQFRLRTAVRCIFCRTPFTALNANSHYCSLDCRNSSRTSRVLRQRVKQRSPVRCRRKRCDAWFVPTHGLRRYCSKRCSLLTSAEQFRAACKADPKRYERDRARWAAAAKRRKAKR